MLTHLEHEDGDCQHEADPEPPRHVGEFGIGTAVGGDEQRLERHAADRAGARTFLPDLGVHRAGEDRAGGDGRGGCLVLFEIVRRIGFKFLAAARGAEIVGVTFVRRAVLRRVRIDLHPANRVVREMMRMIVRVMCVVRVRMGHISPSLPSCVRYP